MSILFIQFWMNKRGTDSRHNEVIIFLSLGFSILLCMLFPFKISNGLIFDLRFISFVLACFYAHPVTAVLLGGVVALIRVIYGGEGVWIAIVTLPVLFTSSMLLRSTFDRSKLRGRLFLSSSLVVFTCTGIVISVSTILQVPLTLSFSLLYIFIHVAGMMISISLTEYFRQQNLILTRLIRMEKIEIVSHLAASISHEIRNPLTTSRGFVQMVQESPEVTEKDKEFLALAMGEMDRATDIIHDYLTFAKPASENIKILSAKDVITGAIQVIQPLANMNNVLIHSSLENMSIKGNSGLFLQVLVNILKNGIESMPDGGAIHVTLSCKDDKVCILIEDEGAGMTPVQVSRLGEPYFSTKEGKGTGLGMMVVYRVIEAMNGDIQIKSEVGTGTGIGICFPKAEDC